MTRKAVCAQRCDVADALSVPGLPGLPCVVIPLGPEGVILYDTAELSDSTRIGEVVRLVHVVHNYSVR